MKKLLYIIFFILLSFHVFSQNCAPKNFYLIDSLDLTSLNKSDRQLIDSCLTLYHKAKDDTSKVNALNSICENMMHENWEKYQFFQYKLIEKKLAANPSILVAKALRKALASAFNNIGYIYKMQGDIPMALDYYHKSLKIQEEIGNKQGIAISLNNIGLIYLNQGDIPKALDYYHKSLKIQEEIGDKQGIAVSLNNIGLMYYNQGDLPNALEYFNKSLKIQEEIGDKKGIALSLINIGVIYEQDDTSVTSSKEDALKTGISKALEYYHKSLKIYEEIGDKQGIAYSLNNIGFIYLKQNLIPKALEYAKKSMEVSKELGYPENIKRVAGLLYQIYEKQNKGLEALEMYKLFVQMKDSINNEETQKATAQQQAKYEYEKQKTIDDAQHEKQLAVEQETQTKQKVITYATAGGLGLVVIFLIFVFNRLQVTKRQKIVIETQKLEVEQQKEVVEKAHFLLEEKNSEILASIRYAKRIQDALMTSQKYIERNIDRLKSTHKN